jgi:hypothetical protein
MVLLGLRYRVLLLFLWIRTVIINASIRMELSHVLLYDAFWLYAIPLDHLV